MNCPQKTWYSNLSIPKRISVPTAALISSLQETTSRVLKPLCAYSGTFSHSAKTKFGSNFVMFLSSATALFKWESAERDLIFYLHLMTTS